MNVKPTPNAEALIRLPEVRQRVGLARTTIYNMVNAGTFPQPIKLGKRAVAWSSRAVDQWIADQLKQAGQ